MNEKLEALNQEIEKTEKKLRRAQHEEKMCHVLNCLHVEKHRDGTCGEMKLPVLWEQKYYRKIKERKHQRRRWEIC